MTVISDDLNRLVERVIGAAIEVHRGLGPGYLEKTYEKAMAHKFVLSGIPFSRQHPVDVVYKGHPCGDGKLDFLVEDRLIVELKTVDRFADIHTAQVMAYLKATRFDLGLLLNFNVPAMRDGIKRVIRSSKNP